MGVCLRARRAGRLAPLYGIMAMLALVSRLSAAPEAGSLIGNQATATYTDSSGVEHTVTSNIVYVTVQQVAAVTMTSDTGKPAAAGSQVAFPHTLTNTGNGTDTFALALAQLGGDSFDLQNVKIYADADGNGVPDNMTPITTTGPLELGESFRFVVVGTAPATATSGQTGQVRVTATSAFDGSQTASNTDTVTVTNNAVINATKAINQLSGAAPSGPYTFTISYTNNGLRAATDVRFTDLIPAAMTYVPGSGRWSGTGATALTDAAGGDTGIAYDYNVTTPGTVTAVLSSVAAGANGTLTMQVTIDSGLAAGPIGNTAFVRYNDGSGTIVNGSTNTTVFEVTGTSGGHFTGEVVPSVNQTSTVTFHNVLANYGNQTDTFDVEVNAAAASFPAGTNFVLYKSDERTLLLDTNSNGVADTGPLAPRGTYTVVLKAVLPPGAVGGGPYTVTKTATSANDPTKDYTATDTLNTIVASTVDLTNNRAVANGAGAGDGLGVGPELGAVTSLNANPGQTLQFTLFVNNTSAVADTYNLAASTDATFAALTLPAGLTVQFKTTSGTVITNTGVILPNTALEVIAHVSLAGNVAAGQHELFFRAQSPTSGSTDRKHDAVTVNALRAITVQPDNIGQVSPGGSVVYTHTITNQGNVLEGDGVVSRTTLGQANSAAGFSSVIYWDKNNNGVLDAEDVIAGDLGALVGGTNGASTAAGLDPGESATLFMVVYATPGVAVGATDVATLTVTTTQGTYATAAPAADQATDTTSVIAGNVVLIKKQALDADRNGVADTAFSEANIAAGAIPGACIRYELTVTNTGTAPALNVVVTDGIPTFTTYHPGDGSSTATGRAVWTIVGSGTYTACTAPAAGGTGNTIANIGTLQPNQSAKVTFGVRIQP
ncbi:MAG: DUF11 domain-containing protein [Armatimonadetes bacterium]|nr:DUF11 domain-containing protein [Armatimonadota bacterium]